MTLARSFEPVASRKVKALILGSMPGERSLEAQQYYAHPRNAFWPIMQDLFGIRTEASYRERLRDLKSHRLALWDVLAACHRPGSLDSSIDEASIVPNDLGGFLLRHPGIRDVFFNGAKAEQAYRRYVLPGLTDRQRELALHRLPSTSPANAGLNLAAKTEAWRAVRDVLESEAPADSER